MENFEWTFQLRFALALALGFLIGLERESNRAAHQRAHVAGGRTYTLICLFGFACGWLSQHGIELALPSGILAITAIAIASYISKTKEGRIGWTSEVAALLTFAIGAMTLMTEVWIPVAMGVIGTILLSEKAQIEHWVENLKKTEFLAILKFLLITAVILPVLPNEAFTRFNINPARLWKIVIMVSSVGFVGYFMSKQFGSRIGLWLSGLLGGIVSSTAVSIAAGRIAAANPERSNSALQASVLASSVMYLRLAALIAIINPVFLHNGLLIKLFGLAVIGILFSIQKPDKTDPAEKDSVSTLSNPFEIKPALIFASLFVLLSIITVTVRNAFGGKGIIILGSIVGVVDVDPFILSLVRNNEIASTTMTAAIIVATMSNTFVKGIYFGAQAKKVRVQTAVRYILWGLLHIPFILY